MSSTEIRNGIHRLVNYLSQTYQLSHTVKHAADTLNNDHVLNNTLEEYHRLVLYHQDQQLPPQLCQEDCLSTDFSYIGDRLNVFLFLLVTATFGELFLANGCVNGGPLEAGKCNHGCPEGSDLSEIYGFAQDFLQMSSVDLVAFCTVYLGKNRGLVPVYSEKIKIEDRKYVAVADDNVCFDLKLGQGMHYIDIHRFSQRTTFATKDFSNALNNTDNFLINVLVQSYAKVLSNFQSLHQLESPIGGSVLCSYFKARQEAWGQLLVVVSRLRAMYSDGNFEVRDNQKNTLKISLSDCVLDIEHQNVCDTMVGWLAKTAIKSGGLRNVTPAIFPLCKIGANL